MTLLHTPKANIGSELPDFSLFGIDSVKYSPESFSAAKVLVVVFTCNHCPYAIAVRDRLRKLAVDFQDQGVQFVAINSNDAEGYPEDSFEEMKKEENGYPFPYLFDESQEVAREFGAVCTPDIFVYDGERKLAYRGRFDDNWQNPDKVTREDLREALEALLRGEKPSGDQISSMGCSIKWRE